MSLRHPGRRWGWFLGGVLAGLLQWGWLLLLRYLPYGPAPGLVRWSAWPNWATALLAIGWVVLAGGLLRRDFLRYKEALLWLLLASCLLALLPFGSEPVRMLCFWAALGADARSWAVLLVHARYRWLATGGLFLAPLGLAFAATLTYPVRGPEQIHAPLDGVVVLGAAVRGYDRPSPALQERIQMAYRLYQWLRPERIWLLGGETPGRFPESEVMRRALIRYGLPRERLYTERRTRTTQEQVRVLYALARAQGWRRWYVVSDHFHLRRVSEMGRLIGLELVGVASAGRGRVSSWYRWRDAAALLYYTLCGL